VVHGGNGGKFCEVVFRPPVQRGDGLFCVVFLRA